MVSKPRTMAKFVWTDVEWSILRSCGFSGFLQLPLLAFIELLKATYDFEPLQVTTILELVQVVLWCLLTLFSHRIRTRVFNMIRLLTTLVCMNSFASRCFDSSQVVSKLNILTAVLKYRLLSFECLSLILYS